MRLRSIETPPSFSNLLGKVRHAPAPGLWQGLIEALPTKPLESKENIEYTSSKKHRFTFQHFRRDSHTCVRELLDAGSCEPILSDLDQSEGHWMEKK